MFCSECGCEARGKFCSDCGVALLPLEAADASDDRAIVGRIGDWSQEVRHEVLMRVPEVRAAIEQHAKRAKKGISGEQFLEIYEKIVPGIPMAKIASIIAPLYSQWGINTGKERGGEVDLPVGKAIVAVLCSMAEHGQTLHHIEQAEDGCVIEAALPSDVRSLLGELKVTIRRAGVKATIHAAAQCKGQWMDWGKSRSTLDKLFGDLESRAA